MTADIEPQHSMQEISNEYACQKLIRKWLKDENTPSSIIIPILHKQLLEGVASYEKKGLTRSYPGNYRSTDIITGGSPEDFYIRGLDVTPVMHQYTRDLDEIIKGIPSSPYGNLDQI